MKFNFMRMMVMFDLPMTRYEDKKHYQTFRKHLLSHGFIMEQESIYTKLITDPRKVKKETETLKTLCPFYGMIEVLMVTENEYRKIEYLTGKPDDTYLKSTEELVIL